LYSPSEDALKYQVLDRASFQRFLGLVHSGKVLDAKTMGAWRERLKKQDLIGDIGERAVAACWLTD
jgi:IS5 family transposase